MTPTAFHSHLYSIRPVSGWVLGGFVWTHTVLLLTVHSPTFFRLVSGPLHEATNGWISPGLAGTLLMAIVLIGGLLWRLAGLRGRDLGLPTGWNGGWKLLNAVLITYLLWGLAQLLVAGSGMLGLADLVANPAWMQPLRPQFVGPSIVAVLAGATLEEVMYRGFLFVHLLLALRRWKRIRERWQLGGALAGSQLFFGLNHIPVGLNAGFEGSVLGLYVLQVALVGVLFTILFIQTNNLFVAIGIHALINAPGLPFIGGVDASFIVLMLALGLMLGRPLLAHVLSHVFGPRSPTSNPPSSLPGRSFTGRT